jgi:2-methylcitrate dehydratase PrpD
MTKSFHAGQAAAKGVKSSLLAWLGFSSSKTIFEGRFGFCNVLGKNPKLDEITENLGQPFGLLQVCLKAYPCCACSHSPIWATLELARRYDIRVEDVEQVDVKCDPHILSVLVYEKPKTATEGRFSIQFPLSLALLERRVTLQQFTDEKIKEPEIVALMPRIKLLPTPELRQTIATGRSTIVEIKLKDGRQLVERCDFPPGTPNNPLSDEELFQKYRSCAKLVLPEKETEESIELIMNLETMDNICRLLNLVGVPAVE